MASNQSPESSAGSPPPVQRQPVGRLEERRAARAEHRAERGSSGFGAIVGGVLLVFLGLAFIWQNMGGQFPSNWWALFILLPALGAFSAAWNRSRSGAGLFTGPVLVSLLVGLFFTGLTFALFFSLDLNWIGPLALILVGVVVLAVALLKPST